MKTVHHQTPDQVRAYLREALTIVDELDPPEDLREVSFTKACDLLTGKQLFISEADAMPVAVPASAMPSGLH